MLANRITSLLVWNGCWGLLLIIHVVDANGDPVLKPGVKFGLGMERWVNGRSLGYRTLTEETGPDGTFQLSYLHTDQDPDKTGDTAQPDLDVLDSGTLEVRERTTIGLLTDDATSEDRLLHWSQETRVATSLTLTVPEMYVVASAERAGAGNRVRARLTDQYGSSVGRNEIIRSAAEPEEHR